MYRLLEKILEDVTASLSMWLTPEGKEEAINRIDHAADAIARLAKLEDKEPDFDVRSEVRERAFYKFMKVSGYIRLYLSTFSDELALSVVSKVTPAQLTKIGKLAREYSEVSWEVVNPHWQSPKVGNGFREFVGILKDYKLLEKILQVKESSIDFPKQDLDDAIWDKKDDTYTLREDVKEKIFAVLEEYPDVPLLEIAEEIRIVGSITSNQYLDTADIDVHITPKSIEKWDEDSIKVLRKWFDGHRDELGGYIDSHPIEVYIQIKADQDLMSIGCYDMLEEKWLVGPTTVPQDYDPYEDFSRVLDDIKDTVKDADILFAELKRDVIDYSVIKSAMERISGEDKEKLLQKLQDKLTEMEDDIELLYKERKGFVDIRRTMDVEQALKDVKYMESWEDDNATFKFINRYRYLKTIGDLKDLLADEEITPDEVDKIKSIMGV